MSEATSLGAAIAAGRAVGVWDVGKARSASDADSFEPKMGDAEREAAFAKWNRAVEKSLGWVDKN